MKQMMNYPWILHFDYTYNLVLKQTIKIFFIHIENRNTLKVKQSIVAITGLQIKDNIQHYINGFQTLHREIMCYTVLHILTPYCPQSNRISCNTTPFQSQVKICISYSFFFFFQKELYAYLLSSSSI